MDTNTAKTLTIGERVVWNDGNKADYDPRSEGTVINIGTGGIWYDIKIKWDDGTYGLHHYSNMPLIERLPNPADYA